ncbi:MAG: hypothetical protein RLZZ505_2347 [Verrucomicrobiota bacterium]|jgi:uncharacterized membrane protein
MPLATSNLPNTNMSKEIDLDTQPAGKALPWFLTITGLLTMVGLIAMPFLAGAPDGEKMPDIVRFLGRFHPVILHLPIGIFSLIMLQELVGMFSGQKSQRSILPMFFGAASAVVAVIAGFLLYHGGGFEGELVEDHLWGGLAFSCAAILTLIVKAWSLAPTASQALYRVLLFGSVGVMGYASHDGASITHGPDYLTEYAPNPVRKVLGLEPKAEEEEIKAKPLEEQLVYADIVQPILNKRCVECHKEGKSKGKLRMDTYEMLVKGGKEGSAIEPGSAQDSNIVIRAELPMDDEEHMPPEGKKDIEEHELAVVKWWLDQGGDDKKTVAESNLTDEIRAAIGKLDLGIGKGEVAVKEAASDQPSDDLRSTVAKLGADFPGGLTFESQSSSNLTFTGVSLRKNLTDELFAKLDPVLSKMVAVDLSATSVTDASIAKLAAATDLRMVRLSETAITDASMDTLAKLTKLESVNLYGTKVTDAGVKKLTALQNLKRLYLWQTAVTPAAIEEIKKALPAVEIVTGV